MPLRSARLPRPPLYTPPHITSTLRTRSASSSTPPKSSALSIGTSYEHLVALTLRRLAFNLEHVGGRSDRGIDLLGYWSPPISHPNPIPNDAATQQRHRIPVIVQCKAHTRRPSPSWIRELQGAIAHAPLHLGEGESVVGMLVCKGKMTAGVREAVMKAGRGIVWVQIKDSEGGRTGEGEGDNVVGGESSGGKRIGRVGQVLWNRAVAEKAGRELKTGMVFIGDGVGTGMIKRELRLLWEGRVWMPDDEKES